MELLPGGDLRHRLRKAKEPLDPGVLRQIVTDVCSGMVFLHSKQTVHGDLKSANVLFSAAGRAKVCECFKALVWCVSCDPGELSAPVDPCGVRSTLTVRLVKNGGVLTWVR